MTRPNDGEPCPRCGKPDAAGACACWDTAKSEDRTLPGVVLVYGIQGCVIPAIAPACGCKTEAEAKAAADAFVQREYDRGVAAGRAAVVEEFRLRQRSAEACMGREHITHREAANIAERVSPGVPSGASEAHNERMREEGRAQAIASIYEKLSEASEKSEELETQYGAHTRATAAQQIAWLAISIKTGSVADGSDALAKREAAAYERGRQMGLVEASKIASEVATKEQETKSRRMSRGWEALLCAERIREQVAALQGGTEVERTP